VRQGWDVPGYTEVRTLGSGGFGDVVLARHDESGTLVAIKYLRPEVLADAEFAGMFRAEARVLAALDDPNVVRLYEYVESPAGAAIVMELIEGVSLREILSQHGKTTAEAALVVLQGSLLGLAAAHARGVVHRDYKPENVLVDGAGVSKLTDFGIAARAGDRAVAVGTLAYAPPEQFGGGPASPAGDVYSATATFYECLAGHPPFTGGTAEMLLHQHQSEPVPLDPVPEPLRPLITAGMAKDPGARPADATSFVTELRAAARPAYGQEWEQRGRSHLGEATLLLATLWPSGAAPAAQGHAIEQIRLSHPQQPHDPGQTAQPGHAQHPGHGHPAQPGHGEHPGQGHPGQPGHGEHPGHGHPAQPGHGEHPGQGHPGQPGHGEHPGQGHPEHHIEHVEHEEHLAHLRHLRREDGGRSSDNGGDRGGHSTGRRMIRRVRTHPVAAAVIASAVAVVIAVVAAFATTGHDSAPPPSGAPSPGGSTAAASAAASVPSFTATYSMTRHINVCTPAGSCITGPLPLTIDCNGSSCTASSGHWGSSHQLAFNGTSFSFTGTDSGVYGCGSDPATITLNLTVVSWRGSGATRKPQQLSGPYNVTAQATGGCSAWHLEATLTSQ